MSYYLIRHKASGEYMPLMKRGKGYTHWNPNNQVHKVVATTGIPRLLRDEKHAKTVIRMWFQNPNMEYRGYTSPYGEDDYDVIPGKSDGRVLEDLEIVKVNLVEEKHESE